MNLAIENEDLGKRYGDVRAVEHLSLRVAEGEIYAFLGLNGAGKTTTIRMLLGMIKPTTGYANVLGTRVRLGSREPWAAVGYLVEAPRSYPELTVYENLEVARRLHPGTPPAAVGQIDRAPGAGRLRRPAGGQLSQGNAQRLGLAKALLHEPQAAAAGRARERPGSGRDRRDPRAAARADPRAGRDGLHVQPHPGRGRRAWPGGSAIIHEGRLLQELDVDELERIAERRLLVRARDVGGGLSDAGRGRGGAASSCRTARSSSASAAAVERPDDVNRLLVEAGLPPTQLVVEEEELEQYFLRLVGLDGRNGGPRDG